MQVAIGARGRGVQWPCLARVLGEGVVAQLAVLAGQEIRVKKAPAFHEVLHILMLDVERHLLKIVFEVLVQPRDGGVASRASCWYGAKRFGEVHVAGG